MDGRGRGGGGGGGGGGLRREENRKEGKARVIEMNV